MPALFKEVRVIFGKGNKKGCEHKKKCLNKEGCDIINDCIGCSNIKVIEMGLLEFGYEHGYRVKHGETDRINYNKKTKRISFYRYNIKTYYYGIDFSEENWLVNAIHLCGKYDFQIYMSNILRFCKIYFVDKEPFPDKNILTLFRADSYLRGLETIKINPWSNEFILNLSYK